MSFFGDGSPLSHSQELVSDSYPLTLLESEFCCLLYNMRQCTRILERMLSWDSAWKAFCYKINSYLSTQLAWMKSENIGRTAKGDSFNRLVWSEKNLLNNLKMRLSQYFLLHSTDDITFLVHKRWWLRYWIFSCSGCSCLTMCCSLYVCLTVFNSDLCRVGSYTETLQVWHCRIAVRMAGKRASLKACSLKSQQI